MASVEERISERESKLYGEGLIVKASSVIEPLAMR